MTDDKCIHRYAALTYNCKWVCVHCGAEIERARAEEATTCKYRCRTNREAFMAGWTAYYSWAKQWYEDDNPQEDLAKQRAWREWRKGVKGDASNGKT